jgi:hypothetical protein
MALHLRPVGPLPAATYWTRRAGVLGGLLLLLVVLRACTGGDQPATLDQAAAAPSASVAASPGPLPSGTGGPSPSPSPSPPVGPCPDASVAVTAEAAQDRYAAGGAVVLRLTVRNTGTVPCLRPLGQGAVELTVFSGSDRIWSSDDCRPGGPPGPLLLAPGQARTQTITWNGMRSRPGCTGAGERSQAGTYRVVGRAGEVRSSGGAFQLV